MKTTCKGCGQDIDILDPGEMRLTPSAFSYWCGDCINAALLWGMERWKEAGMPGAKKNEG